MEDLRAKKALLTGESSTQPSISLHLLNMEEKIMGCSLGHVILPFNDCMHALCLSMTKHNTAKYFNLLKLK